MLSVTIQHDQVRIGERFAVSFQRTLRIPDDGRVYPLPAGLGRFPIYRVADYRARIPAEWQWQDGVFIPMYQREALWLGFEGASWKPNAVKVGVGSVNAVTGAAWDEMLHDKPQDYLVCPYQPWLDGINIGNDIIRQFVAVPLGQGLTIESQLAGQETGGLQLIAFEPLPNRFSDEPLTEVRFDTHMNAAPSAALGLGAGGQMAQKIYPDPYGLDTWDPSNRGGITIYLLNSEAFRAVTGADPPPTPVTPELYAQQGMPWFDLYDESRSSLLATAALRGVRSVRDLEQARGPVPDEPGINPPGDVHKLRPPK